MATVKAKRRTEVRRGVPDKVLLPPTTPRQCDSGDTKTDERERGGFRHSGHSGDLILQSFGKHYLGYAGPAGEAPNVISGEARTAKLRCTDYVCDLKQDVEVIYYFVDVCHLVKVEQRIAVGIIEGDSKNRDAPACSDQLHQHGVRRLDSKQKREKRPGDRLLQLLRTPIWLRLSMANVAHLND